MNRFKVWAFAAVSGAVLAVPAQAATVDFEYEKIASSEFLFNNFFLASINNNDDVAFWASFGIQVFASGIFVNDGTGTQAYETSNGPIATFSRPASINDNGVVAYSARTDDDRSIVAVDDGGPGFTQLATADGSFANQFTAVDINNSGQVAAVESDAQTRELAVYDDAPFSKTVLQTLTGADRVAIGTGPSISEVGTVAANIELGISSFNGVLRQNVDGQGTNVAFVDPGSSATNVGMSDDGAVAFVEESSDTDRVMRLDPTLSVFGGGLTEVASFDRSIERVFTGVSINDSDEIAFTTIDQNGAFTSLYLWSGGALNTVLSRDDMVDNQLVRSVLLSNQSLSNTGTLALQINLFDEASGAATENIFRATRVSNPPTPVPLPASSVLLLASFLLFGGARAIRGRRA